MNPKNNPAHLRQTIVEWNIAFHGYGGPADEPEMRDGIEFWQVGRNASHDFYVGVRGDKIYRYSVGEGIPENLDDVPPLEVSEIEEIDNLNGYFGHF